MIKLIDNFFEYAALIILAINVIIYFKSCRGKYSTALFYFKAYLLVTFTILVMSNLFAYLRVNNLFLSHFYFIFQFILLSFFYKKTLITKNQKKSITIILLGVLSIITLQYSLNPSTFLRFNILEIFLCSFPLVIYSIVHLYNSLTAKGKFMYINAGVLTYLSTSTLIFILGNCIINITPQLAKNIWLINKVLYAGYLMLIYFEWHFNFKKKSN